MAFQTTHLASSSTGFLILGFRSISVRSLHRVIRRYDRAEELAVREVRIETHTCDYFFRRFFRAELKSVGPFRAPGLHIPHGSELAAACHQKTATGRVF